MALARASGRIIARLLGEFFREMAVLVAVFVPLELAIQGAGLTVTVISAIVVVVAALLALGVLLEVKSR